MNEEATILIDNYKKEPFWQKEKFWLITSIFALVFFTFFFSVLGAYTKREAAFGLQVSAMGEQFFAANQTDWFLPVANSFLIIILLIPIILLFRKTKVKDWKLVQSSYFMMFTFTIVVFTFESVSLIAFMNNYLALNIDVSNVKTPTFPNKPNIIESLKDLQIELLNKKGLDIFFGVLFLLGLFKIIVSTIFVMFTKAKDNPKLDIYRRAFNKTGIFLLGSSMFLLMLAAFGAGALGINSQFYNLQITGQDGTYDSFNEWSETISSLSVWGVVIGILNGIFDSTSKSGFWGVNNNWSGYLLFILLSLALILSIFNATKDYLKIKDNKFVPEEQDNNFVESFIAFTLVVFLFYFLDRYIIVFVDDGLWNPNLFNGRIISTIAGDYRGTAYFWTILVLFNIITISTLIFTNEKYRNFVLLKNKRNKEKTTETNVK